MKTLPRPSKAERRFFEYVGAVSVGSAWAHSWVFAESEAELVAAVDFYHAHSKPGMTTEARIARAIGLAQGYGAEARHQLSQSAEAPAGPKTGTVLQC